MARFTEEDFEDDLEHEQIGREKPDRRRSEGTEEDLTELAAPNSTDRARTKGNSLEDEQKDAQRHEKHRPNEGNHEAELTEVVAPEPVQFYDSQGRPQKDDPRSRHDEEQAGSPSSEGIGEKPRITSHQHGTGPHPSHIATEIYIHAFLILFSILGTLARLGTEWLTAYPNAPWSSTVLWANVGGSFFMGFLSEDRRLFREEWGRLDDPSYSFHPSKFKDDDNDTEAVRAKTGQSHGKVKKTIPLFIGLATGFCGSYTSFSSFQLDAFLAMTDGLPADASPAQPIAPRNGGYSFLALLAILMAGIAIPLAALQVGAHAALLLDSVTPTLPFRIIRKCVDPVCVPFSAVCWLGAVFLAIWPPGAVTTWRNVTLALVFAPLGCLLRFHASKLLNARVPSFPLGTFAVNIFGTLILGVCYDLQHAQSIGANAVRGGMPACSVLEGVIQGFCGCTTTVSTWVLELKTLRRRHAYIYGAASVATALSLLIVIMGSMAWTAGFRSPVCK